MRDMTKKLIGAAVLAASSLLALSSAAQAYDGDRWDRRHGHERWRSEHRHHYRHDYVRERPVVVRERPVFVERQQPIYMAPQMYAPPMYAPQQGPSGLNLNFNIPLN